MSLLLDHEIPEESSLVLETAVCFSVLARFLNFLISRDVFRILNCS